MHLRGNEKSIKRLRQQLNEGTFYRKIEYFSHILCYPLKILLLLLITPQNIQCSTS